MGQGAGTDQQPASSTEKQQVASLEEQEDSHVDGDAGSGGSGGGSGSPGGGSARTQRRRQQRNGRRRAGDAESQPEDQACAKVQSPPNGEVDGEAQSGQGKSWVPNASAQPFWLPNVSAEPFVPGCDGNGPSMDGYAEPFVPGGVAIEQFVDMNDHADHAVYEAINCLEGWCPYGEGVFGDIPEFPLVPGAAIENQEVDCDPPAKNCNYKVALCRHWERGHCALGERCNFAHGSNELRQAVDVGAGLPMNGSRNTAQLKDARSELLTLCGAWGALSTQTLDRSAILKFRHCSKALTGERHRYFVAATN
jgi:hypothetical protein